MKRKVIKIDEEKCTGCGNCIPDCPEGALQIIDGKARLISDLFCDGLGACIGSCPEGAITVEEREAEPYDEKKVMENVVKQGEKTIIAHLEHLKEHGEENYLQQAIEFLKEKNIEIDLSKIHREAPCCPGMKIVDRRNEVEEGGTNVEVKSQLRQWPIQMHLISPSAGYFKKADLLLVADCVGYSYGNFHNDFLKGRSVIIACPKLDEGTDRYIEKLKLLIDQAEINTLTVIMMEVPCCGGLLMFAKEALSQAKRKVPLKKVIVSIEGKILEEKWEQI